MRHQGKRRKLFLKKLRKKKIVAIILENIFEFKRNKK